MITDRCAMFFKSLPFNAILKMAESSAIPHFEKWQKKNNGRRISYNNKWLSKKVLPFLIFKMAEAYSIISIVYSSAIPHHKGKGMDGTNPSLPSLKLKKRQPRFEPTLRVAVHIPTRKSKKQKRITTLSIHIHESQK